MHYLSVRTRARFRHLIKPIGQAAVGALTIGILRTARCFDPIRTVELFGRIARSIGPMTREQKIGRANLTAAFPEKSPAEIEAILAAHHPPAWTPLSWRVVRRSEAGPRCRRADRRSGNDAGGHVGDRELDPRISRSVAYGYTVAGGSARSSAVALTGGISSSPAMRRSISLITRFENGPRCM
jgi:hypothetical protein